VAFILVDFELELLNGSVWERLRIFLKRKHSNPRRESRRIRNKIKALREVEIEENGKSLAIRTECLGTCGKIFQAVGVAIPPTIREL